MACVCVCVRARHVYVRVPLMYVCVCVCVCVRVPSSVTCTPATTNPASNTSRVVPAMSVTIARSLRLHAFSRLHDTPHHITPSSSRWHPSQSFTNPRISFVPAVFCSNLLCVCVCVSMLVATKTSEGYTSKRLYKVACSCEWPTQRHWLNGQPALVNSGVSGPFGSL